MKLQSVAVLCALAVTASAHATTEVSSATSQAPGASLLDKMYVNYFAIFHGAPFSNFTSTQSADRNGALGKGNINLDSDITAAYMLTRDIGVGADIPFLLVPVQGKGVILGDLGVKAFNKKTISYRGFDLYTNLILQAPTSGDSQNRGMSFAVKTTPYFRYSFPSSRFAVGAWTEAKSYLGVTAGKTFKLYGAPYVGYTLTRTLSLNFEYEMEAHHDVGQQGADFSMYQTDFEPGLVWFVTPKVMVNPYVQIFTTNTVSSDRMALGAVISATVL